MASAFGAKCIWTLQEENQSTKARLQNVGGNRPVLHEWTGLLKPHYCTLDNVWASSRLGSPATDQRIKELSFPGLNVSWFLPTDYARHLIESMNQSMPQRCSSFGRGGGDEALESSSKHAHVRRPILHRITHTPGSADGADHIFPAGFCGSRLCN